ncbi:MAG: hypothetical protein HQ554_05405, partial [FCB group bacterium]|nr:hypothetical protein [FCB group bacterium]
MISEKKLKVILILLAAIIICGWLTLFYIQNMNSVRELAEEKLHNLTYLELLKRAITNNIIASETIEKMFMAKLEMTDKILQNQTGISKQQLQKLCMEHDLLELSFIDLTGNVINSNLYLGIYPHDLSLLELQMGEITILSLPADSNKVFGSRIVVKKDENLYFVGAVSDSVLNRYTKDISLTSMIDFVEGSLVTGPDKLPEVEHTLYVVIQDTFGILAATSNITSLKRIEDDEFLKKIYQSQQTDSRFTIFGERTILETVTPFRLNGYDFGVIRLGVSLQRFNRAQSNKRLVLLLFSFIFISSLFLEYLFYRNYKKLQGSRDELNTHRRMVEIARLGGEVAHEIKNPLNSIFMILQRLRIEFEVKERGEEFKSLIKISYTEIERLNRIVEQFLSLSRELEIKRQSVDVNRIISSVVDLFSNNTSGVRIKFEDKPQLLFSLDEKLLKQVLINLLKNALEAFDPTDKQQQIDVTSKKIKHNLMISIWDNGCGITAINLSR